MNALVVYFSRTGNTRTLARQIATSMTAQLEEITDRADRRGLRGYLRSGREAWLRKRTELVNVVNDPGAFDLVILGTPVWSGSLSSPVRTYLEDHAARLPRVAFFCTMGGAGKDRVFRQMEQVCGKQPIATLSVTERQLRSPNLTGAIEAFVSQLRRTPPPTPDRRMPGEVTGAART